MSNVLTDFVSLPGAELAPSTASSSFKSRSQSFVGFVKRARLSQKKQHHPQSFDMKDISSDHTSACPMIAVEADQDMTNENCHRRKAKPCTKTVSFDAKAIADNSGEFTTAAAAAPAGDPLLDGIDGPL